MPLMTKIRESLSTFFSVFAGLFVVYIVLDWGMDITGRRHADRTAESQQVGSINKEPVLARDFAEMVRRASDQQKQQTGIEPDENAQKQIRDQVWQQLVDDKLYDEQVNRLGIKVTDEELRTWITGDDPPAMLRQQFTDSTGRFNREIYDQTIRDPKNKAIMINVEKALRKQREREKLQSIVMASVAVDESDVRQRFIDQTTKYTLEYLYVDPAGFVGDSAVTVTDDDARRYYNEHSDEYKLEASRKIKYVMFTEAPSRADSEGVMSTLGDIVKRTKEGADFTELARNESDTPVSDSTYIRHGTVDPETENAVFAAKAGDLVGPIREGDGYDLIKLFEFRTGTFEAVHASHILINIEGTDSAKALKTARDVAAQARGGKDFASLARQYSKDASNAPKGGDLGWFGKGRMVKPFEEAAFKAKPGQIVGPVRTPFGYHIIHVIAKDNREARVAQLHMAIRVSPQTRSEISQRAQDFAYLAKQGSFDKEAQLDKYTVTETPAFRKDGVIPGIGLNQALSKFAFSNKAGTISDPFTASSGHVVCMVSEVKEAGIRPFDEMKTAIEANVRREKKTEKTRAAIAEARKQLAPGDSLGKLTATHPGWIVEHANAISLGNPVPGMGRDLGFVGGVSALKPGETSGPVESYRGIYLIHLLSVTPFDSAAYNVQRPMLWSQLLNERRNRFFTEWTDQLKKSADIVDNRDVFYR